MTYTQAIQKADELARAHNDVRYIIADPDTPGYVVATADELDTYYLGEHIIDAAPFPMWR